MIAIIIIPSYDASSGIILIIISKQSGATFVCDLSFDRLLRGDISLAWSYLKLVDLPGVRSIHIGV